MARRLSQNLNSSYIEAMNRLGGRKARHKIVAYVESFDDVLFWSNLLRPLETERYYFEVMLPSRNSLCKGKKTVLQNRLGDRLGSYMIACVDADYDYLMQGATQASRMLCASPYVFHTYVYSIENFQCYAPSLQGVCVMSTLNDRRTFDFEAFMRGFSEVVWPLFVWNIWAYRYDEYKRFSMSDFYNIVQINKLDYYHPDITLAALRHRVNSKIARLHKMFPAGRKTYKPLVAELQALGLQPADTYLYMRGHDLFDGIVAPMLQGVCDALRREREKEIRNLAIHQTQKQNELAAYQHSIVPVEQVLRRHAGFEQCAQYLRVQADVRQFLAKAFPADAEAATPTEEAALSPPDGEASGRPEGSRLGA